MTVVIGGAILGAVLCICMAFTRGQQSQGYELTKG